jgi:hypothetical protein
VQIGLGIEEMPNELIGRMIEGLGQAELLDDDSTHRDLRRVQCGEMNPHVRKNHSQTSSVDLQDRAGPVRPPHN